MTTAVLLVFFGALSRLLPHPPDAVALGAVALYAGARLPRRLAFAVPIAAMALSDFFLDFGTGRPAFTLVRAADYAAFAAIAWLGFARARSRSARPLRLAALSAAGSLLFFLVSNVADWISGDLYAKTPAGLGLCFAAAIPFFWRSVAADLAGTAVLFGADALARRRTSAVPIAAAALVLALLPARASGQQPAPVSETVVVTATSTSEDEKNIGSAITVITRDEIEKSGKASVLELLRTVPGLDVVQSGTPGALTSLFTRGTNSTQTLVLVDGVRMNSPFFAGYDWSAMTTENVERIEVVRGPFSALYGSDAIGGVVQIFTRAASPGVSGEASGGAGNQGQGEASAFVSAGSGPFSATASYRYEAFDGERVNSDWRQRNGAWSVNAKLSEGSRIGFEGSILDGEAGNPGPVGAENPTQRGFFHEERFAVPAQFALSPDNHLDAVLAEVVSKPAFDDPQDGFSSQTDAQTLQARVADTAHVGAHTLTGFASWERWKVNDASNFGSNLNGETTTLWGLGAQDSATFGAFTVTGGVRFDHHSTYGDHWSPRATVSWISADRLWKVRASGGGAFRAPTIGELYYPFSGNPDLEPETSVSWEVGAERYVGGGRVEASLFWNELRNLIVYDFAASLNYNVGRARTRGVEVGWRQQIAAGLSADAAYTYLDAENLVTGAALARRPRHRASLGLDWQPVPGLDLAPRVLYVGDRPDNDPLTGAPVQNASSVRVDLAARWQIRPNLAPYLRFVNLLDRRYDEVAGYPAPGRLVAGGLDVRF